MIEKLATVVDHPYVFLGAVVLSVPCFVLLASLIFPNPDDDAREDLGFLPIAFLSGAPTMIGMKVLLFCIVCGACTTTFYRLGAWLVGLF